MFHLLQVAIASKSYICAIIPNQQIMKSLRYILGLMCLASTSVFGQSVITIGHKGQADTSAGAYDKSFGDGFIGDGG